MRFSGYVSVCAWRLKSQDLDGLGENFEKAGKGFIDFLLLNEKGFPFIVLEAKSEDKNPLVGKEQARKYARSQNCRFVERLRGLPERLALHSRKPDGQSG